MPVLRLFLCNVPVDCSELHEMPVIIIDMKMKITKRFKAVSVFTIMWVSFLYAQSSQSWKASPELAEKLSESRPGINYFEEKVPSYKLPDVLTASSGKRISSARGWKNYRRQEVLELFRKNVYGRVPATQYTKDFKVINEDKNAMGGDATLKQVDISLFDSHLFKATINNLQDIVYLGDC